ncbi:transcription factor S [Nitrososphaera sp.]|uniref:transcription factor S n=1 Tax=Nitrososphaera sp. TaxID=1971748 RepID=UPI00307EEE24
MRFCPQCQARLKPSGESVVCPKCGYKSRKEASEGKSVTEVKQVSGSNASLKVMDDEKPALPTINIPCPQCGNDTAVWWMLQTRSADEATTQFFRCTKCNHTWRNYS